MSRDNTNYLRGIAILLVVAHHVSNNLDTRVLTPLGGVGVAIFLTISGYGLNESFKKKGLDGFWKNKIIRVIIPCWIVEIIASLIKYQSFEIIYFLKCLLCIEINWYIRYLIYWYAIFYITSKFLPKYRLIVMSAVSTVMLLFLPEIEAEQSYSFLFGVILSESPFLLSFLKQNIWLIGTFFVVIGVAFLGVKQIPIIRDYEGTFIYSLIQLLIKFPLGCALIVLSWKFLNPYKYYPVLGWLGSISYELYLVHCKLLYIPKSYSTVWGISIFYVISVTLSWLLYRTDSFIAKKFKNIR